MAAVATFIGYSVAVQGFEFNAFLGIAMAVAFIICGAGQAINDFFDRGIDAKTGKEKPIPSGKISAKNALAYAILLFLVGNLLAFTLTTAAFLIAATISAFLIIYSALLNKAKYLGNFIVALGTAFPLLFGAALFGYYGVVGFFVISAFFVNFSRELIKDFEDREKDKGVKKTLPLLVSAGKVNALILLFYVVGIVVAFSVFVKGIQSIFYFGLISVASILFLYSFKLVLDIKYSMAQKIAKSAMIVALIAFAASVL